MASPGEVTGADGWKAVADRLNAAAERLTPLGMFAGYHNHGPEWQPVDGKRPMDILAAATTKNVALQFDIGTCVAAGADPVAWINANPGRIKSMHCKDWAPGKNYGVLFGEGVSPWAKIFEAAEVHGRDRVLPDRTGSRPRRGADAAGRGSALRIGRRCGAEQACGADGPAPSVSPPASGANTITVSTVHARHPGVNAKSYGPACTRT